MIGARGKPFAVASQTLNPLSIQFVVSEGSCTCKQYAINKSDGLVIFVTGDPLLVVTVVRNMMKCCKPVDREN